MQDVLGMPLLREDSARYVGRLVRGQIALRDGFGRAEALYLVYFVLSAASLTAFIAFNVWLLVSAVA
jgi:hypothetical protein